MFVDFFLFPFDFPFFLFVFLSLRSFSLSFSTSPWSWMEYRRRGECAHREGKEWERERGEGTVIFFLGSLNSEKKQLTKTTTTTIGRGGKKKDGGAAVAARNGKRSDGSNRREKKKERMGWWETKETNEREKQTNTYEKKWWNIFRLCVCVHLWQKGNLGDVRLPREYVVLLCHSKQPEKEVEEEEIEEERRDILSPFPILFGLRRAAGGTLLVSIKCC